MNENNQTMLPESGKKFEQIDALRFFAVSAVLITHWGVFPLPSSIAFLIGSNGVNLFFTISGFLITLGLIKAHEKGQAPKTSLWKFYIRRGLRIFPIYYLMLAIIWFVHRQSIADGIWWYLTYTVNFYCIKIQDWGKAGVGHLWSLSIEEQFYSLWPFLILFTSSRLLPFLFGTIITLSIAFKIYVININAPWWVFYMNPLGAMDILCLGALLAYGYCNYPDQLESLLRKKILFALILMQAVIVISFRFTEHYIFLYEILSRLSFGLFSIWFIGRAVLGFDGIIGYILNSVILRYIGKISYGVYLYHVFAPELLSWIKYPLNNILKCALYFILTIIFSAFSWHFFESQLLKLKEKFN